jgi:ankyrin repeat protein
MDTINLLIDAGADIEDFDNEGVSIFDMAISHNHKDMFDYLIEQGIDVDKTTRKSRFTPLMAAASYGRADMLKTLLQNGANKDAVDKHGFKAIDFARKMNKKSILKLLDN